MPPLVFLRMLSAALLFVHGAARVRNGVAPFGEFLAQQGIPFGSAAAWGITIFELTATVALAGGRYVVPICAVLILELAAGIALVHARAGWFVVGAGRNGAEYSVLLIGVLVAVALDARRRLKPTASSAAPATSAGI